MNDRHRQVERARRMLVPRQTFLDRLRNIANQAAFTEATDRVAQAFRDLALAVADALNAAVTEIKNSFDWEEINATAARIQGTDKKEA